MYEGKKGRKKLKITLKGIFFPFFFGDIEGIKVFFIPDEGMQRRKRHKFKEMEEVKLVKCYPCTGKDTERKKDKLMLIMLKSHIRKWFFSVASRGNIKKGRKRKNIFCFVVKLDSMKREKKR